jgi:hypothetical protein
MPLLTREQVKGIVLEALTIIADLPDDPEEAPFDQLQEAHKRIFLTALADNINQYPYPGGGCYYDAPLTMDSFDNWTIVADCIDEVFENQVVVCE